MKSITEDFSVDETVNVKWRDVHDLFNHDFTGTIKEINEEYIIVEDQDGECFACDVAQISHNSDQYVHKSIEEMP